MKKKLLLAVVILCIVALGAEINLIFENGLKEVEELVFSLLLIGFWLFLIMYLFNSVYLNTRTQRNWYRKNENITDFY